ncbi:hypothetical protein SKAU_G00398520 [Synaphobranchus kaupii]|uniref:Uncharacterized protein n=1 Tax=Synaphobranchus kaupii TaxID=118154 RepID=A0A9Q1IA59_SYNKA|nr:hypothetical protein SKAU_G00398520 [Synaphobranchus kaupii]
MACLFGGTPAMLLVGLLGHMDLAVSGELPLSSQSNGSESIRRHSLLHELAVMLPTRKRLRRQTPGSAENSTPVPEPEASGETSQLGEARQTAQRAGPSQENVIEPQTQQAESVKEAAVLGTATASGETSLKGGSEDASAETLESVELGQNEQSSGEGAVEAPAIGSQGNSEIEDMDQDYNSDTQSVSDVLSQDSLKQQARRTSAGLVLHLSTITDAAVRLDADDEGPLRPGTANTDANANNLASVSSARRCERGGAEPGAAAPEGFVGLKDVGGRARGPTGRLSVHRRGFKRRSAGVTRRAWP